MHSRQAFIWPYDESARLVGEHFYEDKTPARVREIHLQELAKLEAARGDKYWMLGRA